jgi:hypothetical protein
MASASGKLLKTKPNRMFKECHKTNDVNGIQLKKKKKKTIDNLKL